VVASELLDRLVSTWRRRTEAPPRQALLALFFSALFVGAHLARVGTPLARAAVAGLLLLVIAVSSARWLRERRDWRSPRRTIGKVLKATDPELGERALRALTLVERTDVDKTAGSPELARLHFERLIARASLDAVDKSAQKRAARWRWAMLALSAGAAAAFAAGPMRVIEGLDVLCAYGGRAPLPLVWLDSMRVSSQPPAYLRSESRLLLQSLPTEEPEGSLLTVRGVPRRDGRKLVLTDGTKEVPFVSDGKGYVVARWQLAGSSELRVAARFGSVLVHEPEALSVRAVADLPPKVELEGAPRQMKLGEIERVELRYAASDDRGLRQIDLVLRAGGREERRMLARLDGESGFERGGHVLSVRDPFLRRTFLPVVVTVEARDNDPLSAPKWGRSAAITLLPSVVGEPEAERHRALADGRDLIAEVLALQLGSKLEKGLPEHRRREAAKRAGAGVRTAATASYGGLTFPNGLRSFLLGQVRLLEQKPRTGASPVRKTEDVLLAIDAALRSLAVRDAQSVSVRLADVADEGAAAAKQARESEQRDGVVVRLDAAVLALSQGSQKLATLGMLGRDLGGVANADLGRVRRARAAEDFHHAELALRHLAERLRRPNPSFGAAQSGGVESGVGSRAPSGEASRADTRFDQLAGELEQLVQEHADEIGSVEQALAEAEQAVDLENLREEARQRADAIRRAAAELPQAGAQPGSARAAAALGREHAAAMAQSLERLALGDAVESGRDAMSSLGEALKRARDADGASDWLDEQAPNAARDRIKQDLAWAEQVLERMKAAAEARAQSALKKSSEREVGYARRTGNLAGRGGDGETALPRDALEALERAERAMHDAARALEEGRGERGLRLQREAQRLLEQASTGQTTDPEEAPNESPEQAESAGGREIRTGGEVPNPNDQRGAEEFRRRVLEGLGRERSGRLAPAVQRYAEGLLR
jgi:hypothetical protein